MALVTYISVGGATGRARRAVRSGRRDVVLLIETDYRSARIRIKRRAGETARLYAARLAAAARTASAFDGRA